MDREAEVKYKEDEHFKWPLEENDFATNRVQLSTSYPILPKNVVEEATPKHFCFMLWAKAE